MIKIHISSENPNSISVTISEKYLRELFKNERAFDDFARRFALLVSLISFYAKKYIVGGE